MAEAEAPLRISTSPMSSGFKSATRLIWSCCSGEGFDPLLEALITSWLFAMATSLTITPSTT